MTKRKLFTANVSARKMGSQGQLYNEKRVYEIGALTESDARDMAILRAYREHLEHVRIDKIVEKTNG